MDFLQQRVVELKAKILFTILYLSTAVFAQTKLSSIFNDNMVLQRDVEIPIWGFGNADNSITVLFNEQSKSCIVNKEGKWGVKLSPEKYGGPFELKVISEDTITIKNILVGEVWVCSGQSNMSMPLGGWGRIANYKEEIKKANYPNIRLCTVPLTLSPTPNRDVNIKGWFECNSESVELFSAAAYFFGKKIYNKLNIPIGLIHVSKGGTPVESWMSEETLENYPEYQERIDFVKNNSAAEYKQLKNDYKLKYKKWLNYIKEIEVGLNSSTPWYSEGYLYSDWGKMNIPTAWEFGGLGEFDGVVWFKKEVDLSDEFLDSDLMLNLGAVQDIDITFFNGVKLGEGLKRNYMSTYKVPKSILRKGKNTISVFVLDHYGVGGLWDKFDAIELQNKNGKSISLAGDWYFKTSINLDTLSVKMPIRPKIERYPTILFNGMIAPIIPFAMRGVIWYQGESNSKNAYLYRDLFKGMITDWRDKWGYDFDFFFVQLANYKMHKEVPSEDSWAEIRESQSEALELEKTGMASAIDIGDEADVHPKNKQEVGRRLALLALNKSYNQNIPFSGPQYLSHTISNDTIYVKFNYTENGLTVDDGMNIREFTIAGKDEVFHNASAKIIGDKVAIWSSEVKTPIAVRYAWQANPDVNLYNSVNLPAYPFRTDNWKLSTQK